ncbi:MAG: hypothetical protein HZT40_09095 [Candidatus Thiothrix singaporensis]|uniref:Uncharacterized protein n=1 Tax=Candidatus Thiothrix singaporensis TaxID=2799669 RepID=A0A7L6ARK9_9GAMM|nr:MAG: hypothetical protein HZT40_09095 [Candidatus Thiothrix singaporensis]
MGSMVIPAEAFGLASSAETGSPAMRKLLPALFHRDASVDSGAITHQKHETSAHTRPAARIARTVPGRG